MSDEHERHGQIARRYRSPVEAIADDSVVDEHVATIVALKVAEELCVRLPEYELRLVHQYIGEHLDGHPSVRHERAPTLDCKVLPAP